MFGISRSLKGRLRKSVANQGCAKIPPRKNIDATTYFLSHILEILIISIEDKLYNNEDVRHVMYEKRASDPQLTVSLKADQAARMEIISDIHNELRKADALKLNYSTKVKAPN